MTPVVVAQHRSQNVHRSLFTYVLALLLCVAAYLGTAVGFADASHTRSRSAAVTAHSHRAASRQHRLSARHDRQGRSDPSGMPIPRTSPTGWHQVLADDFSGSTLDLSRWMPYTGQPGGDPGGWWEPSHVSVANGMLVISGYRDPAYGDRWVTGGVTSSPGLVQTYGSYLVRFRINAGVGIAHAILLWPADNASPPEIDFSEDNGANRRTDYAFLHHGGVHNGYIPHRLAVNLTRWHTLGVRWTPGRVVYTIDGRSWASDSGRYVPSTPMVLDIQTEAWACGASTWERCPNASTPARVNLDVDWVVAYAKGG